MQIDRSTTGAETLYHTKVTNSADFARLWLSGASADDLVRVSRLLKHMCEHCQKDDDYEWSTKQVRKITGFSETAFDDYAAFDDALRDGLRELAKELPELNVCPVYRPSTGCQGEGN